jgi:hypothetical protein
MEVRRMRHKVMRLQGMSARDPLTIHYPFSCCQVRQLTKQGTPKFITKAHYILATISLKFRARITKVQRDVPKALKHGISLVRLAHARTMAHLAAAERIVSDYPFSCHQRCVSVIKYTRKILANQKA